LSSQKPEQAYLLKGLFALVSGWLPFCAVLRSAKISVLRKNRARSAPRSALFLAFVHHLFDFFDDLARIINQFASIYKTDWY
jgi:3-methyladenine DNA glycosylase/8-oxoguanine DNA glycosylase